MEKGGGSDGKGKKPIEHVYVRHGVGTSNGARQVPSAQVHSTETSTNEAPTRAISDDQGNQRHPGLNEREKEAAIFLKLLMDKFVAPYLHWDEKDGGGNNGGNNN